VQNYPNPFNPSTRIAFWLPAAGYARLRVFDVQGRLVQTLIDAYRPSGWGEVHWDAREAASGVYLYRLQAGGATASGKMALIR
jgi:hypothetical protein